MTIQKRIDWLKKIIDENKGVYYKRHISLKQLWKAELKGLQEGYALAQKEFHMQLPMSSNKDTSETKQVAEEWSGLNQERDCLEIPSNGSCPNKCKSLPLAPDKIRAEVLAEVEKIIDRWYNTSPCDGGGNCKICKCRDFVKKGLKNIDVSNSLKQKLQALSGGSQKVQVVTNETDKAKSEGKK